MTMPRRGGLVISVQDDLMEACRGARKSVRLVSPFVSRLLADTLAFQLAGGVSGTKRLLTALDPRAVAVGALSIDGLRGLQAVGVEVRTIANLHAKVFLIDDRFAVVGSGNLTGKGLGGGVGDNLELGVVLTVKQHAEASKIFEGWWRVGQLVTERELRICEQRAAKIRVPRDAAVKAIGPEVQPEAGRAAERMRRRNKGHTGFWMKMHRVTHPWRRGKGELVFSPYSGTVHDPKRRPSFQLGDLLVIYAAGTHRCPSIVVVTGPTEFDRDRVIAEVGNQDGMDNWGWVTPVELFRQVAIEKAPRLDTIGVDTKSVRQQSHIVLSAEQYGAAYAGIIRQRLAA
jgi:hypothetical protein